MRERERERERENRRGRDNRLLRVLMLKLYY